MQELQTSRCVIVAELRDSADTVIFRIEAFMREADFFKSVPRLHMNADGLVMEFNQLGTGYKRFERISGVKKNNS